MTTRPLESPPLRMTPGTRAVEDAADMVFGLDHHGRIAFANRAAEELTGRSRSDLIGQRIDALVSDAGSWAPGEVALRRRDGTLVWVDVTTWESAGHVWGIARDVTERKREVDLLRQKAFHDPLTGLPNRELFQDRVQQALSVAERTGRPVALMVVDLDRFKEVNDRYGHGCGDEVLRRAAARMRKTLRVSDTVARLGGDEFAVLLPEGDAEEAAHVAMKLRRAVQVPVELEEGVCRVDASVGIATFPVDGRDGAALIATADAAMYDAKRNVGRAVVASRHGRSVRVPAAARRSRWRATAVVAAALVLAVASMPGRSSLRRRSPEDPSSGGPAPGLPFHDPVPTSQGTAGLSGVTAAFSGGAYGWQEVTASLGSAAAGHARLASSATPTTRMTRSHASDVSDVDVSTDAADPPSALQEPGGPAPEAAASPSRTSSPSRQGPPRGTASGSGRSTMRSTGSARPASSRGAPALGKASSAPHRPHTGARSSGGGSAGATKGSSSNRMTH